MPVNELFDEWITYEKVVAGDYMHHRRYFEALSTFLRARFDRPLAVLDLGCGDAVPALPLFEDLRIARYTGVDPSAPALERARANLAGRHVDTTFLDCTMEEATGRLAGPFDVILASFSLHHLDGPGKEALLVSCRSLLAPDGVVAVVDVYRDADESRASWLDRWEADARARFVALAPVEIERLVAHVRENDLPETMENFEAIAVRAGLPGSYRLAVGPGKLNGAILLDRDPR